MITAGHRSWVLSMGMIAWMVVLLMGLAGCDESPKAGGPGLSSPARLVSVDPEATEVLPCCPVDSQSAKLNAADKEHDERHAGVSSRSVVDAPIQDESKPPAADQTRTEWRASQWVDPSQRETFDLGFSMTDQDGRSLTLADLLGRPIAMTFIFTRCPNPQMCPLITTAMGRLQNQLEKTSLADQVYLVLLSYDPVFDTPDRLKKYGAQRGLEFTNAYMLRPDPDQFRQLLDEFQIGVHYNPDGSIGHFIELLLIDHQGRFVRDYQGDIWSNAAVLDDLKQLVAEMTEAAPAS